MSPPISNIAILGATGTIGHPILTTLQSTHPTFHTSILLRPTSTPPPSTASTTNLIRIPTTLDCVTIAAALREHRIDALVLALAGSRVEEQKKMIDAAFLSGCIKRVVPAEFGSCDSADEETNEVLPLMKGKGVVRAYLEEVCARDREGGKLSWTSLVTGHFFDWGLVQGGGLLGFDLKAQPPVAKIVDGGDVKSSGSTLPFIAKAVVRVFEIANQKASEGASGKDPTKNKLLYIHSHHNTQLEVLAALEQATGQTFTRKPTSSPDVIKQYTPAMLDGDISARDEIVAVWGLVKADWEKKGVEGGFANVMLGLDDVEEKESLEGAVQRCTREMGLGKK